MRQFNTRGIGMIFRGFKGYAVSGKFCSLVGLGFSSSVCSTPFSQGDGALENVTVYGDLDFYNLQRKD